MVDVEQRRAAHTRASYSLVGFGPRIDSGRGRDGLAELLGR